MKNIIVEPKVLQAFLQEQAPILSPAKAMLIPLKERFGIEFIMSREDNVRMLYECIYRELLAEHSTYTYRLKKEEDNPYGKGEIVKEWLYLYMPKEENFLREWSPDLLNNSLYFFNVNNGSSVTLREIIFNDPQDIQAKYNVENIDKEVLKDSKQIQKAIDQLFMNKTLHQQNVLSEAIRQYLITLQFTTLHNYLILQQYYG
jgi:hypothetical protein